MNGLNDRDALADSQTALRTLVADQYGEMLGTAATVVDMAGSARSLLAHTRRVQQAARSENPLSLKRKSSSPTTADDEEAGDGTTKEEAAVQDKSADEEKEKDIYAVAATVQLLGALPSLAQQFLTGTPSASSSSARAPAGAMPTPTPMTLHAAWCCSLGRAGAALLDRLVEAGSGSDERDALPAGEVFLHTKQATERLRALEEELGGACEKGLEVRKLSYRVSLGVQSPLELIGLQEKASRLIELHPHTPTQSALSHLLASAISQSASEASLLDAFLAARKRCIAQLSRPPASPAADSAASGASPAQATRGKAAGAAGAAAAACTAFLTSFLAVFAESYLHAARAFVLPCSARSNESGSGGAELFAALSYIRGEPSTSAGADAAALPVHVKLDARAIVERASARALAPSRLTEHLPRELVQHRPHLAPGFQHGGARTALSSDRALEALRGWAREVGGSLLDDAEAVQQSGKQDGAGPGPGSGGASALFGDLSSVDDISKVASTLVKEAASVQALVKRKLLLHSSSSSSTSADAPVAAAIVTQLQATFSAALGRLSGSVQRRLDEQLVDLYRRQLHGISEGFNGACLGEMRALLVHKDPRRTADDADDALRFSSLFDSAPRSVGPDAASSSASSTATAAAAAAAATAASDLALDRQLRGRTGAVQRIMERCESSAASVAAQMQAFWASQKEARAQARGSAAVAAAASSSSSSTAAAKQHSEAEQKNAQASEEADDAGRKHQQKLQGQFRKSVDALFDGLAKTIEQDLQRVLAEAPRDPEVTGGLAAEPASASHLAAHVLRASIAAAVATSAELTALQSAAAADGDDSPATAKGHGNNGKQREKPALLRERYLHIAGECLKPWIEATSASAASRHLRGETPGALDLQQVLSATSDLSGAALGIAPLLPLLPVSAQLLGSFVRVSLEGEDSTITPAAAALLLRLSSEQTREGAHWERVQAAAEQCAGDAAEEVERALAAHSLILAGIRASGSAAAAAAAGTEAEGAGPDGGALTTRKGSIPTFARKTSAAGTNGGASETQLPPSLRLLTPKRGHYQKLVL